MTFCCAWWKMRSVINIEPIIQESRMATHSGVKVAKASLRRMEMRTRLTVLILHQAETCDPAVQRPAGDPQDGGGPALVVAGLLEDRFDVLAFHLLQLHQQGRPGRGSC